MAKTRRATFIHPDLGIGGAERLVIDAALALQGTGHKVVVYTSHRDKEHCFDEARDGTLDVQVRGNSIFPVHICGRLFILMAILRQLHLTVQLLWERYRERRQGHHDCDRVEELFFVDQLPTCVPLLKLLYPYILACADANENDEKRQQKTKSRILFYSHFPDQLLSQRDQKSALLRLLKKIYRCPFDWLEKWTISASDKVVANSNFSRETARKVFGNRLAKIGVVYPCVNTDPDPVLKNTNVKPQVDDLGTEKGLLGDNKKILLSINRFERKKNIALAIRAYNALGEENRKNTRLVIAGGYDTRVQENVQYHRELDNLARSFGLKTITSGDAATAAAIPDSADVAFLLSVPSSLMKKLLSCATVLLYTPAYEHFGIVPVEAMHYGLPVLATNTGGPLETIVDSITGWLRPPDAVAEWADLMRKLLCEMDETSLQEMGRRGRARVEEKFSAHAMTSQLTRELDEMFEKESQPFDDVKCVLFGLLALSVSVIAVIVALL